MATTPTPQQARDAFVRFMFGATGVSKGIRWEVLSAELQADIDAFIAKWPAQGDRRRLFKPPTAQPMPTGNPDELDNDRQLIQDLKAAGIIQR